MLSRSTDADLLYPPVGSVLRRMRSAFLTEPVRKDEMANQMKT